MTILCKWDSVDDNNDMRNWDVIFSGNFIHLRYIYKKKRKTAETCFVDIFTMQRFQSMGTFICMWSIAAQ